jgi:putative Ca2+/H+ antiporter (TMEM165/GDT1 family)
VAAVFGVVFVAELPDKTLIASLVLSTRYQPLPVWLGVASAFTVHVTLAVAIGGALGLLPHRLVQAIVALLFAGGAVYLFVVTEEAEEHKGEEVASSADELASESLPPSALRVAATAFVVIFLAEWGDITQIATANLAARYRDPVGVGIGAALALWAVGGLAVATGRNLLRLVRVEVMRRVAGIALAAFAVVTLVELIRS